VFDPWVGKIPWKRGWLPIPVFWPGEFHSPWDHKELDMTEWLNSLLNFLLPSQVIGLIFTRLNVDFNTVKKIAFFIHAFRFY